MPHNASTTSSRTLLTEGFNADFVPSVVMVRQENKALFFRGGPSNLNESLDNSVQLVESLDALELEERVVGGHTVKAVRDGKWVVEGPYQRSDVKNANQRVYPRKLWERLIGKDDSAVQESVRTRSMLGHLEHPGDGRAHLKEGALLTTSLKLLPDGVVWGRSEILDNPNGMILQEYCAKNIRWGVSSRGAGSVGSDGRVSENDYALYTFDAVSAPSTPGAFPVPVANDAKNETVAEEVAESELEEGYYLGPAKHVSDMQAAKPIAFNHPMGNTSSGKAIPHLNHDAYTSRHRLSKHNGNVGASDGLKAGGHILRHTLPHYNKQDHLDAANAHMVAANVAKHEWGTTQEKAHMEKFGKKPEATDYKVSGVGQEGYAEHHKEKLRDLSRAMGRHAGLASGHEYAAKHRLHESEDDMDVSVLETEDAGPQWYQKVTHHPASPKSSELGAQGHTTYHTAHGLYNVVHTKTGHYKTEYLAGGDWRAPGSKLLRDRMTRRTDAVYTAKTHHAKHGTKNESEETMNEQDTQSGLTDPLTEPGRKFVQECRTLVDTPILESSDRVAMTKSLLHLMGGIDPLFASGELPPSVALDVSGWLRRKLQETALPPTLAKDQIDESTPATAADVNKRSAAFRRAVVELQNRIKGLESQLTEARARNEEQSVNLAEAVQRLQTIREQRDKALSFAEEIKSLHDSVAAQLDAARESLAEKSETQVVNRVHEAVDALIAATPALHEFRTVLERSEDVDEARQTAGRLTARLTPASNVSSVPRHRFLPLGEAAVASDTKVTGNPSGGSSNPQAKMIAAALRRMQSPGL